MQQRLSGLDSLRAMACLMIVLHHIALQTELNAVGLIGTVLSAFAARGSYGVVIFFVLSGFLLSLPFWQAFMASTAMPSLRAYWVKRLARIVPAYYVALAGSALLALALGVAAPNSETATRLVAGAVFFSPFSATTFFPVEMNGPLWSIAFEVLAYAGLPIVFALFLALPNIVTSPRRAVGFLLLLILMAVALNKIQLTAAVPAHAGQFAAPLRVLGEEFFTRFSVYGMFALFACGSLAGAAHVRLSRGCTHKADIAAAGALAAAAGACLGLSPDALDLGRYFLMPYEAFPVLPMAIGVFLVSAPRTVMFGKLLDRGPTRYIATVSFGVYIYHMPVLHLASLWVVGDTLVATTVAQVCGVSTVTIIATLTLAHLSFRRIEQPCLTWARRFEKRSLPNEGFAKTT